MTSRVKRITKFNRCIQFVISGHPTVATRINKHFVSAGTQSDTLVEMEGHNTVPKFDPFGDPSTLGPRWTRWLSGFELFADGKGLIIEHLLDTATVEAVQRQHTVRQRRRALLLHSAGADVQDIFLTLTETGDRREYDVAVTALNNYFVPKVNNALARQVFHGINPTAGETIQQFATRLKKAALDCAYGAETDNNIRDAILWKCPSTYIKRRLLEEGDELTLVRTLTLAAQCEKIETEISSMQGSSTSQFRESSISEKVNHLKWENGKKWKSSVEDGRKHQKTAKNVPRRENTGEGNKGACYRCGAKDHYSRDPQCPAMGRECSKCHKKDHFAKVCKTKRVNCVDLGDLDLGHQDGASGRSSDRHAHEYAFRIGVNTVNTDDLLEVEMGGVKLHVLADSGAYSNLIDERTWEQLKAKHIKCTSNAAPQNKQIYAYASDKPLEIKGTFECEVRAGKGREKAEFVVVRGRGVPLLGKQTATKLGMIKVGIDVGAVTSHAEQFRHEFPEVFTGLGKTKDTQITSHIDPSVTPVAQPLRRTPVQLRERVEENLKQLVELDIIEPVAGPTPWVDPTVIARKRDGYIMPCTNTHSANEAIIREHHPIPTVDEADPLSRLLKVDMAQQSEFSKMAEEHVRFVAINSTPKAMTTHDVERASSDDAELQQLRECIDTGRWTDCPDKLYAAISGELCVIGQLVLRGSRIVMPRKLRPQALALAHEGHLGIVGTKQALRSKVWWPGIDRAVETYCRSCHGCQLVARPDAPEPIRSTTLPVGPWIDVGVDLLGPLPSGHSILVVVDYYSRYYEYSVLQSTTTEKVLDSLDDIFSRQGWPMTIKSDNGPQFRSDEFGEYCTHYAIQHLRVTAKWAQANGEVERQNASIMKRVRIAQAAGLNWKKELRTYVAKYRGLPHTTTGKSPAELNYNRKFRGKLPDFTLEYRDDLDVRDKDAELKGLSKMHADERRGARYTNVDVGDEVLVRQDKVNKFSTTFNPTPCVVVRKSGNSLIVESPDGVQYSRNSSHVRKYVAASNDGDVGTAAGTNNETPTTRPESPDGSASRSADTQPIVTEGPTPHRVTTPPVAASPAGRPQRARKMPIKLADYVT